MSAIHPTTVIDKRATLGKGVRVGPYTVIDGDVEVGDGTTIGSHNVITGHTKIGRENRIYHFCSIGEANQDKKYKDEPTRTEIGDRNTIREYVSIHRGTVQDVAVTRVGNDNWIMAHAHIAHDCRIGDNCVLANNVTFGGHVQVGDWVTMGGFASAHQYVKIGAHVMAQAFSIILQDVPPYVMIGGNPIGTHGINSEGLKRRNFTADTIAALKRAYKTLYRSGLTLEEARAELEKAAGEVPEVKPLVDFLATSTRGILR